MSDTPVLPRILVIDDLAGRVLTGYYNPERAAMCSNFMLDDVSPEVDSAIQRPHVARPVAQAVFFRGQSPIIAGPGDVVENDLERTLQTIAAGWETDEHPWALLILDLCFLTGPVTAESHRLFPGVPDGFPSDRTPNTYFGLQILESVQRRFPEIPVVIMSGRDKDPVSREYTKRGALDFLAPDLEDGDRRLLTLLDTHGLFPDESGRIKGTSKALLRALRTARQTAGVKRNVLIRGERGSGKELFARFIHDRTLGMRGRPFETIDCGSLQPSLFASELFGYERGAFTGADKKHPGIIPRANGGDLFLDEIGNLPADIQTGILRVIDQRVVNPLGSASSIPVDVRFLAATNENLEQACIEGRFRDDLLDRLREAGTLTLPPLRERLSDLPTLAEMFVRQAEASVPNTTRRRIDPDVLTKLREYNWPGNIRELRTCLFVAVLEYPSVEHLMPAHVRLSSENAELNGARVKTGGRFMPLSAAEALGSSSVAIVGDTDGSIRELAGALPRLDAAHGQAVLQALRAALIATRRRSLQNPDGDLLIHPAIRLLSGSKTLSASQAADTIKRIFHKSRGAPKQLMSDPILAEALAIAKRLRPSTAKKTGTGI